jgi:hypothetical protein
MTTSARTIRPNVFMLCLLFHPADQDNRYTFRSRGHTVYENQSILRPGPMMCRTINGGLSADKIQEIRNGVPIWLHA